VQLDPRADGVAVVLGFPQQLRGLGEAALPNPECGEPDDRSAAQGPVGAVVLLDRRGQLALRVDPPAGRGEHATVVGAADRADRHAVGARDEAVGQREPFLGAADMCHRTNGWTSCWP